MGHGQGHGGAPADGSAGNEPGGAWGDRGGESPGRSGSSPGHLKKEAGERSAAPFAPGRTGTAVEQGVGPDRDDGTEDRDEDGERD